MKIKVEYKKPHLDDAAEDLGELPVLSEDGEADAKTVASLVGDSDLFDEIILTGGEQIIITMIDDGE